jgi:uncharacterized integral membrane protein
MAQDERKDFNAMTEPWNSIVIAIVIFFLLLILFLVLNHEDVIFAPLLR